MGTSNPTSGTSIVQRVAGLFAAEPVLVIAAFNALVTVGAAFGLNLPVGAAVAVGVAITAIAALVTRSQVSPA